MSSAALPPLSRSQERWIPAGLFAVIALSACTAPLHTVGGLTLTGDRLLGLLAVVAVAALAISRRLPLDADSHRRGRGRGHPGAHVPGRRVRLAGGTQVLRRLRVRLRVLRARRRARRARPGSVDRCAAVVYLGLLTAALARNLLGADVPARV